jgi:hypothetical protein
MMIVMNGVIWLWLVIRAVVESPVQAVVVFGSTATLLVLLKLLKSPEP